MSVLVSAVVEGAESPLAWRAVWVVEVPVLLPVAAAALGETVVVPLVETTLAAGPLPGLPWLGLL